MSYNHHFRSSNSSTHSGSLAAGSPYLETNKTRESLVDKYSLSADPNSWGTALSPNFREADDDLHNPDPKRDHRTDHGGQIFTRRGAANLGCIAFLVLGMITLFAGYPVISLVLKKTQSTNGGFNLGGLNASGQVPSMAGNWGLIDVDTPKDKYFIPGFHNPKEEMQLVFSDEFNKDGRTFYPGEDPYWEAYDMNYWVTKNLEWYDPSAIITKGGNLEITLSNISNHGLYYMGGMMTTWNKFCFTGGILLANVVLPGANNVAGLWPALWSMGNLGRAGYGATVDGMWPYSYDSCDVGTVQNQTFNDEPALATQKHNDGEREGALSYLPGQRLSRCTCPGETHPGPIHSDGTYVGRSAPEIDAFEAQIVGSGHVSQSAQWAPFNDRYLWFNTSANAVYGPKAAYNNFYHGGAYQQTTSSFTATNPDCYELETGCFATYGFEYKPGFDGAYISWISEDAVDWTLFQAGLAADPAMKIGPRPIPQEPMYLIVNLGISPAFGDIDFEHLTFPAHMLVDWVRVYQPKNAINIGCDPPDYPTKAYIEKYIDAYNNVNLTTWEDDFKQTMPKNSFLGQCDPK